ncbi:MAG: class I SAM-dependent methyltransferase [Candidatus Riflebacteria bacterium]|nr:class I SAM-dependent methyltransferase [Candidatus Riflebacteria bacterium]
MLCKICGKATEKEISAKILNKYTADFFKCKNCCFLQTSDPFWLEEAYKNALNIEDTGVLQRNILISKILSVLIFFLYDKNGKFLDYAGGYGIFVRLMRDIGFDFQWCDKFSQNLLARGFEKQFETYDLLTALEVFEHFVDPVFELENLLNISRNIFFSTQLLPDKITPPTNWYYYGFQHGQHISFFSLKTFYFLAEKYRLNFYSNGSTIHLLTEKKINPRIFLFLVKAARFGLSSFVERSLNSRTLQDSLNLFSTSRKDQ